MKEIAQEVVKYLQENLLDTIVIVVVAGFAATQTVVHGKKGSPVLYLIVGLLGSFLGQFAVRYFGIKEILDQVSEFRILFDFLSAYVGSFVVASLIHFIKPI